jgi:hypothetical protein
MPLRLSPIEYHNLVEVAHSTHAPRQLHRAQALLWLHEGDTVAEGASRLFGTPRPVFRWRSRLHECQALEGPHRLADRPRSGRPNTVSGVIAVLRSDVIDDDPRHWGYHVTVWIAPLLRQYLREVHPLPGSRRSVGVAMARQGMGWTRPRYALARRAPPGRQAKGSSNAVLQGASAP